MQTRLRVLLLHDAPVMAYAYTHARVQLSREGASRCNMTASPSTINQSFNSSLTSCYYDYDSSPMHKTLPEANSLLCQRQKAMNLLVQHAAQAQD